MKLQSKTTNMISEQTINTISKYRGNKTALVLISNKWKETVKYHVIYKKVNDIVEHVHYRLCIDRDQFDKLDEKDCERVYWLNLNKLNLTVIPEKVWMMHQLRILDWSHNRLEKLPKRIGRLARLQQLWLFCNQLEKLPKNICRLTQLRGLSLGFNKLTKLPKSIGQLTQLQYLDVSDNKLRRLPESITSNKNIYVSWFE